MLTNEEIKKLLNNYEWVLDRFNIDFVYNREYEEQIRMLKIYNEDRELLKKNEKDFKNCIY